MPVKLFSWIIPIKDNIPTEASMPISYMELEEEINSWLAENPRVAIRSLSLNQVTVRESVLCTASVVYQTSRTTA